MKKNEKPKGFTIAIIIIAVIAFITHCDSLNGVPGVSVDEPEVTVDIGDFHYHS